MQPIAGVVATQAPFAQTCPAAHGRSHEPQLSGSRRRSTHERPHSVRGALHFLPHVVPSQMSFTPEVHVCPHEPQLSGSLLRSTQAAPQRASPGRHAQVPAPPQTSRGPQGEPQDPQASASSLVATQRSVQSVALGAQPHSPAAHPENGVGHLLPQALQ